MLTHQNIIEQYHRRLFEHFGALKENRNDKIVFAIEHGLNSDEIYDLADSIGSHIRHNGFNFHYWNRFFLPLICCMAEIGYEYRGTGTDFWPKVDEKFSIILPISARSLISELFEKSHRELGVKKPVASPWNNAYKHISWPISNSIAPIEIHKSLANMISKVGEKVFTSSHEKLMESLKRYAEQSWHSRLRDWLSDVRVSDPVVAFIVKHEFQSALISREILNRIDSDIKKDTSVKSEVNSIREKYQQYLIKKRPSDLNDTAVKRNKPAQPKFEKDNNEVIEKSDYAIFSFDLGWTGNENISISQEDEVYLKTFEMPLKIHLENGQVEKVPQNSIILLSPDIKTIKIVTKNGVRQHNFTLTSKTERAAVSINCFPTSPTVEDILNDNFRLIINTIEVPVAIEKVNCRISIWGNGDEGEANGVRAYEKELASFNVYLGFGSPTMSKIKEKVSEIAQSEFIFLKLELEGLLIWKSKIFHRQQIFEYDEQSHFWTDENGEVIKSSALATSYSPILQKIKQNMQTDNDGLQLLVPYQDKTLFKNGFKIFTPKSFRQSTPDFSFETIREIDDLKEKIGLGRLAGSYFAWSSAFSNNVFVAQMINDCRQRFESKLIAMLCGKNWLEYEKYSIWQRGDASRLFIEKFLKKEIIKIDGGQEESFKSHIAKELDKINFTFSTDPREGVFAFEGIVDDAVDQLKINIEITCEGGFINDEIYESILRQVIAEAGALQQLIRPEQNWDDLTSINFSKCQEDDLLDEICKILSRSFFPDDVRVGLSLWLNPSLLAEFPDWQDALEKVLLDRQAARIIRYGAKRFKFSQSGEMMKSDE